jgi:sulfur-oxidizing protein SoxB
MSLSKREFLQVMTAASAAGMGLARYEDADAATAEQGLYDLPPLGQGPGFVSLLHMTDCHAQLRPIHFREPSVNLGLAGMQGQLPHLVGEHLLKKAGIRPGTALSHAFTYIDFERAARRYGKVGGFAHLATLVKRLKASRPGALLLDGGDTWQGSATSLWTNAQDMVDACKALTVDVMTGHWEFTYGMQRVKEIVEKDFAGGSGSGAAAHRVDFVAQNIKTNDFGDPVFKPYVMKDMNGVKVAIVGQAFPYTPIANPRYMVADWEFGIQDANMQKTVDEARAAGAQVVVVLSHNGMDVDLKTATRTTACRWRCRCKTPAAPRWSPTPAATASSWA